LVQAIEIYKNWAERLTARSTIGSLACFPGNLSIESKTFVKDHVTADASVQASFFGDHATRAAHTEGACGGPGRQESAEAKHGISLLRLREAGHEEESANHRE
jgi:hypothetical protein